MKLVTIESEGKEKLCVCMPLGSVSMEEINRQFNKDWPCDMLSLIQEGGLETLNQWFLAQGQEKLERTNHQATVRGPGRFAPLYRHPRKIWGIGLNYAEHAADLSENSPGYL